MMPQLFVLLSLFLVLAMVIKRLGISPRNVSGGDMRWHTPARFEGTLIGAPSVEYEDKDEQQDATFQRAWSNRMRESGRYMRSPFYKKVICLLISWDKEHDDLRTESEVSNLGNLLQDTFRYKVKRVLLKNDSKNRSPLQLMRHIVDFICEEDGPKTLLIVYYAGHGAPNPRLGNGCEGLTLTSFRKPSDDEELPNEIVWGRIEETFQHAEADVFEIFDCCYAGDLGRTGRIWGPRSFEFLGACSSGQVTCKPGPESFTNALMWALRALEAKHKRFTVSELACKIREAPGFPSDQVPAFFIRAPCAIERIMLSPLDDIRDDPAAASEEFMSQELLQLNFGLAERASIKMIEKLAKTIDLALSKAQLPVNWVAWGGLNSLGGPRPYLHSDLRVIQAVRLFQDGINRKKSRKESQ